MKNESKVLRSFKNPSILQLIPGLNEIATEKGEVRLFQPGEHLCTEGKALAYLMLPLNTHVILARDVGSAAEQRIGLLQRGRSLCLMETLRRAPAPYTALAQENTSVLTIPVDDVVELVDASPDILNYLSLIATSPGSRSLKRFLVERGASTEQLFSFFSWFAVDPINLSPQDKVDFSEPALYLVDTGQLQVEPTESNDLHTGSLATGSWFGTQGLVAPFFYTYQVEVGVEAQLRRAKLKDLRSLFEELKIVEEVVSEPWISRRDVLYSQGEQETLTELGGDLLGPKSLAREKLHLFTSKMRSASSDRESVPASVVNLCLLQEFKINEKNIHADLALSGKYTFLTISEALESYGINCQSIWSNFSDLRGQRLPGLVAFGPRIMVLVAARRHGVILLDACRGFIWMDKNEFTENWNGRLLETSASEVDRPFPEASAKNSHAKLSPEERAEKRGQQIIVRLFLKSWWDLKTLFLSKMGLEVLLVVTASALPWLTSVILDHTMTLRDRKMLYTLLGGMLLTTAFRALCAFGRQLCLAEYSQRFQDRVTTAFYRHTLSLRPSSQEKSRSGDIQARLGELNFLIQYFSQQGPDLIISAFSVVFFTALLFQFSAELAWVSFLFVPFALVVRFALNGFLASSYERVYEVNKTDQGLVAEQITGIASLKAAAAEDMMQIKRENVLVEGVRLRSKINVTESFGETFFDFTTVALQIISLWFGSQLVLQGKATLGTVLAVNMYAVALSGPLRHLQDSLSSFGRLRIALKRIAQTLGTPKEQSPAHVLLSHSLALKGKIKLERLNFRYQNDTSWVIRDLNLTIYPRQIVAVVGRSGCGKTTLANLLAGIIKPSSGRIFLDDFDTEFLSVNCRQRQIGFVLQGNQLFAGTIGDNIAFADDSPNEAVMEQAANYANASEFIAGQPGGYWHYVAEGGTGLSGGQRQRVLIARVLYRHPRILIMDEATSALDAITENGLVSQMREILRSRTAVIIAHRLSTIRNADRIIVMKDGEIVEDGTHSELWRQNGHYCELFKNQLSWGDS